MTAGRLNPGPVVVDMATAEICRQNFLEAIQDLEHPVWIAMVPGFVRVIEEHMYCNCHACNWLDRQRTKIAKRKAPDVECSDPDCDATGSLRRGMCVKHYKRWRRRQKDFEPTYNSNDGKMCSQADECGRLSERLGMCKMHYSRHWRKLDKERQAVLV